MLRNEFEAKSPDDLWRPGLPLIFPESQHRMEGRVGIELIDVKGRHRGRRSFRGYRNTLTNGHRALVASWLANQAPVAPGWIALGRGSIAEYAETNQDATIPLKSSGADQQLAQEYVCDGTNRTVYVVLLYMKRIGASGGSVWVELQTDAAGVPSNAPVTNGISSTVAINGLSTSYAWQAFAFPTAPALAASAVYHAVLKSSGYTYSAAVTEVDLGVDQSAPGYASGQVETYNGAAWSSFGTASDACFRIVNTPTNVMTTLLQETTRRALTSTSVQSLYAARLLTNFTAALAVGRHGEAGLFNAAASGTMSAAVPIDVEKTNAQQLNVYWVITVN